jgi:polysaccharide pyruvyl transferase WcaK-like protein
MIVDKFSEVHLDAKKSEPRIGLLGPFGFGNLGDAAIQQAMIQNIRKRIPGAMIFGISQDPSDTEKRHGIRTFRLDRATYKALSGHGFIRLARIVYIIFIELWLWVYISISVSKLDILIVSGGGQIDDYWGGVWAHPYTLLRWGLLARLFRTKFIFMSVGAGPLNSPLSRIFARKYLSLAQYISYRDNRSEQYLLSVGCHYPGQIYPDLAHSIDQKHKETVRSEHLPLIGIGPMPYFDSNLWPEKDDRIYLEYIEKLVIFSEWLLKNNYRILLFPGEAYLDRSAIDGLKLKLKERNGSFNECTIIDHRIENVDELMEQISKTDIVVASRFHGVLLAHVLSKPTIAISYHEKIDTLMDAMGHASFCCDIRSFTVEKLIEKFQSVEQNKDVLRNQIAMRETFYREALAQQYDKILLNLNSKAVYRENIESKNKKIMDSMMRVIQ